MLASLPNSAETHLPATRILCTDFVEILIQHAIRIELFGSISPDSRVPLSFPNQDGDVVGRLDPIPAIECDKFVGNCRIGELLEDGGGRTETRGLSQDSIEVSELADIGCFDNSGPNDLIDFLLRFEISVRILQQLHDRK